MQTLKTFTNSRFKLTTRTVLNVFPKEKPNLFPIRFSGYKSKPKHQYVGFMNCGKMSYVLTHQLKYRFPELDFRYGYSKYGFNNDFEDHIFITTKIDNNDIIICPTYKQYLVEQTGIMDNYTRFVQTILPPFFVGTYFDLYDLATEVEEKSGYELKKNGFLMWYSDNNIPPTFPSQKTEVLDKFLRSMTPSKEVCSL